MSNSASAFNSFNEKNDQQQHIPQITKLNTREHFTTSAHRIGLSNWKDTEVLLWTTFELVPQVIFLSAGRSWLFRIPEITKAHGMPTWMGYLHLWHCWAPVPFIAQIVQSKKVEGQLLLLQTLLYVTSENTALFTHSELFQVFIQTLIKDKDNLNKHNPLLKWSFHLLQ